MFAFFEQLGSSIAAVFEFIVSMFKNLISFFQIIGTSMTFIIQVADILPAPIKAGCLCIIGVSVIYLIIGRS